MTDFHDDGSREGEVWVCTMSLFLFVQDTYFLHLIVSFFLSIEKSPRGICFLYLSPFLLFFIKPSFSNPTFFQGPPSIKCWRLANISLIFLALASSFIEWFCLCFIWNLISCLFHEVSTDFPSLLSVSTNLQQHHFYWKFCCSWVYFILFIGNWRTIFCILMVSQSVQSLSHALFFVTSWTLDARPPCPSLAPGACSNSGPWSQWWHPTISSSVFPFSCT